MSFCRWSELHLVNAAENVRPTLLMDERIGSYIYHVTHHFAAEFLLFAMICGVARKISENLDEFMLDTYLPD